MRNDLSKNSSMLAFSAILILSSSNVYCNSTQQPTELQYSSIAEQTTLPLLSNTNSDFTQQFSLSTTYHENEKGGLMLDREYKKNAVSSKITCAHRTTGKVQDLGHYEVNVIENIGSKPRAVVKIKTKITNSGRKVCSLV